MSDQSSRQIERWQELGRKSEEYHDWDPRAWYWLVRAALWISYDHYIRGSR